MVFEVRLPDLPSRAERARVGRWLTREGDFVEYGQRLCELHLEQIQVTQRRSRPTGILRKKPLAEAGTRDVDILVGLIAEDRGYLRSLVAAVGQEVETGETLAVTSTRLDEPLDQAGPAAFRVVADYADPVEPRAEGS